MTQHDNRFHHITLAATVLGGAALAALLAIAGPGVGTAHAHGYSTPSGDAVGRPGLDNPAPGVRLTQAIGDHVFNQSTPFNKSLDDSPLGVNYHASFGTPDYEVPTHGSNGSFTGILNIAGPLKVNYNAAQAAGTALPEEEDLPGTLVRAVSGAPEAAPHTPAAAQSKSSAKSMPTATRCTVLLAKTSLRAQGSC
jgi:hypothetical protein